jgi:hypothetical protein
MQSQIKQTILLLSLFFGNSLFAQDSLEIKKTNPIIFTELYFGTAGGDNGGLWLLGYNINYQFNKKDLLTARFSGLLGYYENYFLPHPMIAEIFSQRREVQREYAILYGKRWLSDNFSFSLSTGISYVDRDYYQKVEDYHEKLNHQYLGVPLELNIKWFKAEKSRFRAYYGLIPIGKRKISFGRSVGFKLTANIAKNNYVGLTFTYGFGWHKKY